MKIITENKNTSLGRIEYVLEAESINNPTKQEVIDFLKGDSDLIVIKEIKGTFGKNIFDIIVFVYENKDIKEKVETITRKQRKKLIEDAKKLKEEQRKAEEDAKNVKPAEENKEETIDGN